MVATIYSQGAPIGQAKTTALGTTPQLRNAELWDDNKAGPHKHQILNELPKKFPNQSAKLPKWVVQCDFTSFVLASWFYAEHQHWPNDRVPTRPTFVGMPNWQVKWLKLQRNPAKFQQWQHKLKQSKKQRSDQVKQG